MSDERAPTTSIEGLERHLLDSGIAPEEVVKILESSRIYQTAFHGESEPAYAGAARLALFLSGHWQMFLPGPIPRTVAERLVAAIKAESELNLKLASKEFAAAIKALPETDEPLRAWLHAHAGELEMRIAADTGDVAHLRTAIAHAESAADAIDRVPYVLPESSWEDCDILAVAMDVAKKVAEALPEILRRQPLDYAKAALNRWSASRPDSELMSKLLLFNYLSLLIDHADVVELESVSRQLDEILLWHEQHGHQELVFSTAGALVKARTRMADLGDQNALEVGLRRVAPIIGAFEQTDPAKMTGHRLNFLTSVGGLYGRRTRGDRNENAAQVTRLTQLAVDAATAHFGRYSRERLSALANQLSTLAHSDGMDSRTLTPQIVASVGELLEVASRRSSRDGGSLELATAMDIVGNVLAGSVMGDRLRPQIVEVQTIALEIESSLLGEKHPKTLSTRLDRAISIRQALVVEFGEGLRLYPDGLLGPAIAEFEKVVRLAGDSPSTARTRRNAETFVATCLLEAGPASEMPRALSLARLALSEGLETASAYVIGTLLAERGEWAAAGEFFQRVCESGQKGFDSEASLETRMQGLRTYAGAAVQAAYCLAKSKRLAEAVQLLEADRARWLKSVLNHSPVDAEELERRDPDLATEVRDALAALAELEDLELKAKRLFVPVAQLDPPTEAEQSTIRAVVAARERLHVVAERARAIGVEVFSQPPAMDRVVPPAGEAVALVLTSNWGSVALVVDSGGAYTAVFDESVKHDDLARFVGGPGGWSMGQLGEDDETLLNRLEELPNLAGQFIDSLADHVVGKSASALSLVCHGAWAVLPVHLMGSQPLVERVPVRYLVSLSRPQAPSQRLEKPMARISYVGVHAMTDSLDFAKLEIDLARRFFVGALAMDHVDWALLESADVVHLAGHGVYEFSAPHQGSVVFGDKSSLSSVELLRRPNSLSARLAIVSACVSSVHARMPNEGVSLASTMLVAGADTALGTMWEVDDLATALVVSRMLGRFESSGRNAALALRDAQLWLRDCTASELGQYLVEATSECARVGIDVDEAAVRLARTDLASEFGATPFRHPRYWGALLVLEWPTWATWPAATA